MSRQVSLMAAHRPHARVLAAAACGDDEALSALVRLHHDRVYRFGLRVCALPWLLSVVRNACLRMLRPLLRERRTLGERVDHDSPVAEPEPGAVLERWQLVRTVHAAIAALAPPYREVLVLRDLEGLTGDETCAVLALEPAAMKTRLRRARAMLRAEIERRGLF